MQQETKYNITKAYVDIHILHLHILELKYIYLNTIFAALILEI